MINVNWWCQFRDPKEGLVKPSTKGISEFQILRASRLVSNLLEFKKLIDT
jgi:hypothetical protein